MDDKQKLIYYKYLLDTGRIDEITYREEVNRLKNSKIKIVKNTTLETKLTVIVLIVFVCIMAWKISKDSKRIEFENIDDFYNIPSPIQESSSGMVVKNIDDTDIEITYKARYILAGRVVDVHDYFPSKTQNKLSPVDIGVTWGYLARDEYNDRVKWSSSGNRFLNMRTSDGSWINEMGGVTQYLSNNHLIPADEVIEKQIKEIKVDDYIKIEGYLVNVYYEVGTTGYFTWNSSTSRNDSGDGACEIIYVTKVSWLQESN